MMKRKLSILMILCLLLPVCAYADTFTATDMFPLPQWQRVSEIKPAPNGGVYVLGRDLGEQGESLDVCMLLDREGNAQWQVSMPYDETKLVTFDDCITLPDGNVVLQRRESPDFSDMRDTPLEEIVRVRDGNIIGVDTVGSGEEWYMWVSLLPVGDGYMVTYTKGDSHGKSESGAALYKTTVELYTAKGQLLWQRTFDEATIAVQDMVKVAGGYVLAGHKKEGFGNTQHNLGIIIMLSDTGEVQWQEVMDGSAATFSSHCGEVLAHADGSFSLLVARRPAIYEERETFERRRYTSTGESLPPLPIDEAHLAYQRLTPFMDGYAGFLYEEEGQKPIKLVILDENYAELEIHDIVYAEQIFRADGWADLTEPENIRLLLQTVEIADFTVDITLFEAE